MTTMPRAALLGLFAIAGNAAAHGGGLDAEGCHNDRKNGGALPSQWRGACMCTAVPSNGQ